MSDRSDDIARRASGDTFRRDGEALLGELRRLLGAHAAPELVADADAASALAAEARAGREAAEPHDWALVRRAWPADSRDAVVALVHAVSEAVGPRPVWLVVAGRTPQVAALRSDVVLDNPLGFAALSHAAPGRVELVLMDRQVPAGLRLGRHVHVSGPTDTRFTWELEVWGAEPWLSGATRALREAGRSGPAAG
jgi:hypothetical protein